MEKLKLVYMKKSEIKGNPNNWRVHSKKQLGDLKNLINDKDIGWAGALLYNEKTHLLIDGHARLSIMGENDDIPVLVGSWDKDQESKILATLDPLCNMAETDIDMLSLILDDIKDIGDISVLKELQENISKDDIEKKINEVEINDIKEEPYTWTLIGCKLSDYGKISELINNIETIAEITVRSTEKK